MALKRKRPVKKQDDESHKRHKFQSFSERIENLNIDVLRKVRPIIPDAGDEDEDTYVFSYFGESVKKWRDLNLSATFTEFYHAVVPLAESLPQVVHHQEKIICLLEEYIARQDALAMASILDMLVQLARDLGEDFYTNYWARTISLLGMTVDHSDFNVIEAAFNTLSWLLKYLAGPLVANLTITFDQLAPLLGKTRQKRHVRRFASEAFAFLLRRVKSPNEVVEYMVSDLGDNEEYSEAVANVFVEGMKAPGRNLHSKALAIFSALVRSAQSSATENSRRVLNCVLEQIIHDSSKQALAPLLDLIIESINGDGQDLAVDLLVLFCSVKTGSKVGDWSIVTDALIRVLMLNGINSPKRLHLAALVLAKADPVTSKKATAQVFELLKDKSESQIGPLSRLIGNINRDYFEKWVMEDLTKYINAAGDVVDEIALWIVALGQDDLLNKADRPTNGNGRLGDHVISKSSPFMKMLTERIDNLALSDSASATWLVLRLVANVGLQSPSSLKKWKSLLPKALERVGEVRSDVTGLLLSLSAKDSLSFDQVFSALDDNAESLLADVTFLEGLEAYLSNLSTSEFPLELLKSFSRHIERNLAYPSHIVRNTSLRILERISRHISPSLPNLVQAILEIENTPRTVDNIRSTALAMRKLPTLSTAETDSFMIAFCFGLLRVNFSPLWSDASGALKIIGDRSGAKLWEKAFSDLTLEDSGEVYVGPCKNDKSNTLALSNTIWEGNQVDLKSRTEGLHDKELQKNLPERHPSPRSQALRVLLEIPHLAEQHSRELVPLFLSLESPTSSSPIQWQYKDRISLLTLFTKFINPKALYKATEVRSTLYSLLHHGDVKLQLLALDAILTWKDVELTTYREGLHNLLDERKFREELTSLIHVDAEESRIEEGHRAALMEIVVRILYGNAVARQGNEGKRAAILSALSNLRQEDQRLFIDLALLPFEGVRGAVRVEEGRCELVEENLQDSVNEKKMVGFVMMVQNLVKALGAGVTAYLPDVLEALIVSMWKSKLTRNDIDDDAKDNAEDEAADASTTKTSRTIRKTSLKVFSLLIDTCPEFVWEPYVALVFKEFVSDKLATLSHENIQSPSTRLQLFDTLAQHQQTAPLLSLNPQIIPSVLSCIEVPTANLSIFETVLRIATNLFILSQNGETGLVIEGTLIMPNLTMLLDHLTIILTDDQFQQIVDSRPCLDLITDVLRYSAPLVQDSIHVEHLIKPLLSLLRQPGKLVNEKIKGGLLESIVNLLPRVSDLQANSTTFEERLNSLSRLFVVLHDRYARITLCQIIDLFAEVDSQLSEIGNIVGDLNAYDTRRLDTPDFDRRLTGFAKLNEELHSTLTPRAWIPVLYNLLFFVQDTEEMSLRTGSAFGLERFFVAARRNGLSSPYTQLLSAAVLPAIKKGLKHSNDLVRREFAGVLDALVKNCHEWAPITDLKVLLVDGDEEANFFNNIFHIQHHRRMRAIMRLSNAAADGSLKAMNLEQIFIPVLEKISLESVGEDVNVAAEAVRAVGVLSGALGWKAFRQMVKRYLGMLKSGDERERAVVRSVCAMVEHTAKVAGARIQRSVPEEPTEEDDIAQQDFLVKTVVNEFYPPMLQYLHHHEESSIKLRIPVAVALVKILKALPEKFMTSKLPAVLTDVAHILRSRSQENRDTSRKTLNEALSILGPRFFGFILKELRAALNRGYQLHVLGFTVHSLLTHLPAQHGALDGCVMDVVDVLMDDIFGAVGSEKDSEGYTSSMKEIKASKSYDSFEILASITSVHSLAVLLSPIRSFLYDTNSVKDGRKISEVLRRIQLGILRSEGAVPSAVLDFCLAFFQSVQVESARSTETGPDPTKNQFIVNLKVRRQYESDHFRANSPKLLRFALETATGLIKKHKILLTEEKLNTLIPLVGDSLVSDIDELRIASLRLLSRVISLPYASIEDGLDVFVDRAVCFIKQSPLTKSELCQASFKFLSIFIRDRKSFTVPENTVIYILERIHPDLQEPERQGISFSLIRAILSRRIVVSEVYDIMSEISNIMITNQSAGVRDTTRALYLQFLMDYPQGRDRLKKQISFLIKNLGYEFESGRQSVMEVLHQLVFKFGDELLQPVLLDLFVGLLIPLANDESATCREMAARLIQSIIENADDERSKAIRTMLRLWARQTDKPALLKASLHVYRILLKHGKGSPEDLDLCVECVGEIIEQSATAGGFAAWDVIEQCLQLFDTLVKFVPGRIFTPSREMLWRRLRDFLMCKNVPTRLAASKLFGVLFGRSETIENGDLTIESLHLSVADIIALTRQFIEQIKDAESTADIHLQALKNLVFIGQQFKQTGCVLPKTRSKEENGAAEEVYCLSWLISRITAEIRYERVVAEHVGLTRKIFVQWIVALVSVMELEDLQPHASSLVASLSRFMDDGPTASVIKSSLKGSHCRSCSLKLISETREIADEGLKLIQTKLGTTAYLEIVNAVRQEALGKREERKMKRSLEAVTDPEKAAQKKIRQHKKAKESKKKKIEGYKNKRLTFGR